MNGMGFVDLSPVTGRALTEQTVANLTSPNAVPTMTPAQTAIIRQASMAALAEAERRRVLRKRLIIGGIALAAVLALAFFFARRRRENARRRRRRRNAGPLRLPVPEIGQRLRFTDEVDLYPHTIVHKGEQGTVVLVEGGINDTNIWVMLDRYHEGLDDWGNCIVLGTNFDEYGDPTWRDVTERTGSSMPREHALAVIRGKLGDFPLSETEKRGARRNARGGRRRNAKRPTFREARERLMDRLQSHGWRLSSRGMKVPYATSPNGFFRVWFKPQSLASTTGYGAHRVGDARAIWYVGDVDIRDHSADQIAQRLEGYASSAGG